MFNHFLHSGRAFFERFAADWKDLVNFKTKGNIFQIQNDPISMKSWVKERDVYTRIQINTKSFESRMYIFVLETKMLTVSVENTMQMQIMVIKIFMSSIAQNFRLKPIC